MDCLCAKFGDFSFSRFGFILRTDIIIIIIIFIISLDGENHR